MFLLEEPEQAPAIVARANRELAEHQQIRGFTIWPEADFPRTHTLKVKKGVLVDALQSGTQDAAAPGGARTQPAAAGNPKERLVHLVSEMSGVAQEQVLPEHTVGGDLNMDSLKRVEMLSIIEQELGVYIDESLVDSGTTLAQLQGLLESQEEAKAALPPFYTWPLSFWFSLLREVLHQVVVFPLLSARYRIRTTGLEHLDGLDGPVLFAANHNAVLGDSMVLAKATPRAWRRHLSFAAAAEITFEKRLTGIVAALVANAFPLSRESAIRASLEHMGRMMDEGWNVVIFPEGEQRLGQPMLPFQSGHRHAGGGVAHPRGAGAPRQPARRGAAASGGGALRAGAALRPRHLLPRRHQPHRGCGQGLVRRSGDRPASGSRASWTDPKVS